MQSRYYNPDWGRFINADALGGQVGTLLSHNLFTYAWNNPVMYVDPSGYLPNLGDIWEGAKNIARNVVNFVVETAKSVARSVKEVVNEHVSPIIAGGSAVGDDIINHGAGALSTTNNSARRGSSQNYGPGFKITGTSKSATKTAVKALGKSPLPVVSAGVLVLNVTNNFKQHDKNVAIGMSLIDGASFLIGFGVGVAIGTLVAPLAVPLAIGLGATASVTSAILIDRGVSEFKRRRYGIEAN